MNSKSEFNDTLHCFCKEIGVTVFIVIYVQMSQKNNKTNRFCHQVGTTLSILEAETLWANRVDPYIGLFKEAVRSDLCMTDVPMILWDYCMERWSQIHNAVPWPLFQNQGMTPHQSTFGKQGDISNICNFGWYQWIYYRNPKSLPSVKECLGRVLCPINNEWSEMSQVVLTSKATIVPWQSIRPLSTSELNSETEQYKKAVFDDIIKYKLGDAIKIQVKYHLPLSAFTLMAT